MNKKISISANSIRDLSTLFICVVAPFSRVLFLARGLQLYALIVSIISLSIYFLLKKSNKISQEYMLVILLALWNALSAITYFGLSIDSIKVQLLVVLLFCVICNNRTTKAISFCMIATAAYFVYCYFFSYEMYGGGIRRYIRIQNQYYDPNVVAMSFTFPAILMTKSFFNENNVKKKLAIITFIILIFSVSILGGSRGGLITVLAGIFVVAIKNIKMTRKNIFRVFLTVVIVGIFISQWESLFDTNILQRFTVENVKESGGSGRLDLAKGAIEYMLSDTGISSILHILFGYGFGSASRFFGLETHNTVLDFLWGNGVIGVIFYVYVIYRVFRFCEKSKSDVALAMIVSTVIWGLTLSASDILLYYVSIYLSMCFAFHYNEKKSPDM